MFRYLSALILVVASLAAARTAAAQGQSGATPPIRFEQPTIFVTPQKESEDKQKVPVSVTPVSKEAMEAAGVHIVSEGAIVAPNTYFTEWSARKLSSPTFRGIGATSSNSGITTHFDGVPQLNSSSSSIELLDIDQIEFVRGPQSALYGRNTLGGLINVASARPSLAKRWTGMASVPFGNHGIWTVRGNATGALMQDKLGVSLSFAQIDRDGFTTNDITGNEIDSRSAFTGKAQLLWVPNAAWEGRVVFTGERARDGDYSLNDVAALEADPFHVARDFEGHTNRDVINTTILARRHGGPVEFFSTTGFVNWKTNDLTDLDYSPLPLARRDNTEDDFQFTQEFRFASNEKTPVQLSDAARLRWQSGLTFFTQSYTQDAINSYGPGVFAPFALTQHTPKSSLDDFGVGLFAQGTVTLSERLDLIAGARFDYEDKSATIEDFFDPLIAPPTLVDDDESFSNVSPQMSAAYRLSGTSTVYGTVGRGYKAGGFNSASPSGSESYGEEFTWNYEGGLKTLWANGKVTANVAGFYIDWSDMQLSVPGFVPGQFYISNVGGAASKGVEFELGATAAPGLDLFTSIGFTDATFSNGSVSSGVNVEGNKIPNTPEYTTSLGIQYAKVVGPCTIQGRMDTAFYGSFQYNDLNSLSQDAYSLVNFRFGVSGKFIMGELLIRNAFDTRYIPIAFPYPFAQSGFLGELGAPRTISLSAGVRF